MSSLIKEFQDAYHLIHSSHYIVIVTHINPDADTLSSALALSNYLFRNNINHKVYNSTQLLPRNLDFLPRFDKIVDRLPEQYDLVIYVDCGDKQRIGVELAQCKTVNIDHHQSNDSYADINIIDFHKGSTAEVLYNFFISNNIKITKEIATCLYIGIYDDTIAFTTPRTNHKTFEALNTLTKTGIDVSKISQNFIMRDSLAKYRLMPKILQTLELHFEGSIATIYQKEEWLEDTGANFNECDEIVNEILKISIVQIAIYVREENNYIRISLRGKDNSKIDLSQVASVFNGGGHKNAAGATLKDISIQQAIKKLVDTLKNYI